MAVGQPLEDREDERGRLAGPGLGPGENIATREDEGDRLALDGGGLGVALVRYGAEQFGRQPEDIEGHWKQQLLTGPSRDAAGPGQGVGLDRDRTGLDQGADRSGHRAREPESTRPEALRRTRPLVRPLRRCRRARG